MPTPREAYVNSVEQQGYSGARVRPADFSAGQIVARSVQGFGQDVAKVGEDLDDIQTIYAQAAAKDGLVQALPRLSAIRSSFTSLQKKDAIGAREKAAADVDAIEQEVLGTLKDSRARRMFKDAFLERRLSALETIGNHERDQVLEYDKDTNTALFKTAIAEAADSFGNEDEMNIHIATAQSVAAKLRPGAGEEELAQVRTAVRSEALVGAWTQIQDPLEKEAFRAKHSTAILPEDEAKIINANSSGLFDARVDIFEEDFFKTSAGGAPAVETEEKPVRLAAVSANPISGRDYSPVSGARRTGDAASHARRGSYNKGIDFAAPAGSAIRPAMGGTVVSRGFDKTRGNYVNIQYDNGMTGIFLHLKGPPSVAQGARVEPGTVIGAVGSTGRSSGPHVHYSVKNAAGNYVDPDTVSYQADRNGVIRNRPQDVDIASVYDRAYDYAERNNLSKKETDALLRRIDVRVNRDRQLKDNQDRLATDAAMERATELGEGLTKASQIPGYDSLPWETRKRIDEQIERNTQPKEPEANGIVDTDMRILEIENPQEFLRKNPFALNMTRAEQQSMAVRQAQLRKQMQGGGGAAIDNRTRIREAADRYLFKVPGITGNVDTPAEKKLRVSFYDSMSRQVAAAIAQNGGKDLKAVDYDNIAALAATTVIAEGKQRALFEFEGVKGAKISIGRIDSMKIAWRRANPGLPLPSDDWFRQQAAGR